MVGGELFDETYMDISGMGYFSNQDCVTSPNLGQVVKVKNKK